MENDNAIAAAVAKAHEVIAGGQISITALVIEAIRKYEKVKYKRHKEVDTKQVNLLTILQTMRYALQTGTEKDKADALELHRLHVEPLIEQYKTR